MQRIVLPDENETAIHEIVVVFWVTLVGMGVVATLQTATFAGLTLVFALLAVLHLGIYFLLQR